MSIQFGEDKIPFIDLGDGYKIRLEYEDLTDEKYIEKARNELRESPEAIKTGIEELRALIKGELLTVSNNPTREALLIRKVTEIAVKSGSKNLWLFIHYHFLWATGSLKDSR